MVTVSVKWFVYGKKYSTSLDFLYLDYYVRKTHEAKNALFKFVN